VDVVAGASGNLGSVLEEVDDSLAQVEFPLEYHAEVLRDAEELQGADRRAMIAVAVVAIIGFLLLQAGLGNWRVATLGFASLILSLAGGAIAVLITGGTVSFGSILGFFAVLGIAAKQVVGLIRHYRHLELHEGASFGEELVVGGTGDRFAPIVAAALTALALFAPLALAGGAGLERGRWPSW
jgi:Cu/Ag efflux pump CusA